MNEYKLTNFKMGLTGTHRTGKTTLAEHVSKRLELPLIKTNASEIFKEFQVKPNEPISALMRLEIQNEIFSRSVYVWEQYSSFITDRTPIDFISYLLMDYDRTTMNDALEHRYIDYINRCFDYINENFSSIVVVPQGLPIQKEDWKGVIKPVYMSKQELIIRGCLTDPRNKVAKYVIDGEEQELEVRGTAVIKTILKNFQKADKIRATSVVH